MHVTTIFSRRSAIGDRRSTAERTSTTDGRWGLGPRPRGSSGATARGVLVSTLTGSKISRGVGCAGLWRLVLRGGRCSVTDAGPRGSTGLRRRGSRWCVVVGASGHQPSSHHTGHSRDRPAVRVAQSQPRVFLDAAMVLAPPPLAFLLAGAQLSPSFAVLLSYSRQVGLGDDRRKAQADRREENPHRRLHLRLRPPALGPRRYLGTHDHTGDLPAHEVERDLRGACSDGVGGGVGGGGRREWLECPWWLLWVVVGCRALTWGSWS